MKCFIHMNQDAVATCKKCGKAMCVNCSAYSGHSGICPECRVAEFKEERSKNGARISSLKSEMGFGLFLSIIGIVLIVPFFIGLYRYFGRKNECLVLEARNRTLDGEINRLESVLSKRGGMAFV